MRSVPGFLLAVVISLTPADAKPQAGQSAAAVVPFDSVFTLVSRVRLVATPQEPLGAVRHLAVSGARAFIVDDSNGNVKVFDIASGKLVTTIGRSGDGPGEIRRISGFVVDSAGSITTIDISRQVVVRRDPAGRLIDEMRLAGQWHGLNQVEIGSNRRLILTGRSGVLTREGGIPVEEAPPVLYELDAAGLGPSFYRVEWPTSAWQRSFSNHFSSAVGSLHATGSYANNVIRFRDWSTNREWSDTLRARWLKPVEWPENEQYGQGTKMQQMQEWLKHQVMVHDLYLGSPRWYVAQVQMYDAAGEVRWGHIVSTTDGRARVVTAPGALRLHALRGNTAYLLTEDESGEYVLEVRRVQTRW